MAGRIEPPKPPRSRQARFNEAGHFHGRKATAPRRGALRSSSFNEAGHFHGRKAGVDDGTSSPDAVASMRPAIFMAGRP